MPRQLNARWLIKILLLMDSHYPNLAIKGEPASNGWLLHDVCQGKKRSCL